MRISWVHPETAAKVRATLLGRHPTWNELFAGDVLVACPPPPDNIEIRPEAWPRLALHIARAERVREAIAHTDLESAVRRFGDSPHAIERASLVAAGRGGLAAVAGVLACTVDEFMAYGQFLSQLVELGADTDPSGTVTAFERFVAAASRLEADEPSWPERLRVARDGLAALYVRVRRLDDAESLYMQRFTEEPNDTTVAIGAGRAFLEAGDTARAVQWLVRAQGRATELGRVALAAQLAKKVENLRVRLN